MLDISSEKKEAITNKLKVDIALADSYYEEKIEPAVMERYAIYKSDPSFYKKMFPRLSAMCSLSTTDVKDTISSAMPAIMKTFFSSQDVITIQGRDGLPQDEHRAQMMQALINFELEQSGCYQKFQKWFLDSLITNLGIMKVDWQRTYKSTQSTEQMAAEAVPMFKEQIEQGGGSIDDIQLDPMTGVANVTYTIKEIDKNRPRFMNLMASEFRFDPTATCLEDADFIAHRKVVSIDYLRRQAEAGLYDKAAVEEAAENAGNPNFTQLDNYNNDHIDDNSGSSEDTGRRKVVLYECYVKLNLTDDKNAILQDVIVTMAADTILRIEENSYERQPFFLITPVCEPHKIWPDSGFVDIIAPNQHAKTAILKQMIIALSKANDCRIAVDKSAIYDVNELLNGSGVIQLNSGGNINQAIQQLPSPQIASWAFNMLQYLDSDKENKSGLTRYNQGTDSNSLNKTATGINLIQQAANQRLELICRCFAETAVKDLFRFLVKLNQLFLNQAIIIRLNNEPLQVDPADLDGSYDLIVNAAMGTSSKQDKLQAIQMIEPLVEKLAQVGMAGPEQFYNVFKKTCESLDFKNADEFVMNPQQSQQYQAQQAQQAQQNQPPVIVPQYKDVPEEVQAQALKRLGYQVTPDMFANKERTDALRVATHEHAKSEANRESSVASDAAVAQYLRQSNANAEQPEGMM